MKHKQIPLAGIKTSGLGDGEFIGYASTFGNVDLVGDRVMPGAFAKSIDAIAGGDVLPVLWEHVKNDPRMQIGQIKSARETDEGLEIHVALDLDTETGQAAYKSVKARRSKALSIGYSVIDQQKSAEGVNELKSLNLMEVSIVSSPANPAALISEVKSETPALVKARKAAAEFVAADETEDEASADDDRDDGAKLIAALEAALEAARDLIGAAEDEGRDLSEDESEQVAKHHRNARICKRELEAWANMSPAARHGVMYSKARYADGFDPEQFERRWGTADAPAEALRKFDAPAFIKSRNTSHKAKEATMETQTRYLGLGVGRKNFGAQIATKITGRDNADYFEGGTTGTKALTSSGQIVTDVPLQAGVIPQGRPAISITDVLPVTKRSGPQWRYIRQSSRALAAAPVAEGATKPTSAIGVQTIDGESTVIAHLSEPADKFVLGDNVALGRFVADELVYGLDKALEAEVISGNGTGAHLTGILNTSGVQVQAYATNALTSIRKAITAQETLGYEPSVLFISPADWEAVELLATSDDAIAFRGVPIDLLERKLWGLRAVLTTALPAKTAVVLDPSAVSVDVVGSAVDIEWDASGALFEKNQMRVRVEGRFGVSVYRPEAIVKVGTAA